MTGSTAAIIQIFIFPSLMWLKVKGNTKRNRVLGYGMLVFGTIVGIICLSVVIAGLV